MFLETDLTYNDNGDLTNYMRYGTFGESVTRYSKTEMTPKEKYIMLYKQGRQARLKLAFNPLKIARRNLDIENPEWRERAFKNQKRRYRRMNAWKIRQLASLVKKYAAHEASVVTRQESGEKVQLVPFFVAMQQLAQEPLNAEPIDFLVDQKLVDYITEQWMLGPNPLTAEQLNLLYQLIRRYQTRTPALSYREWNDQFRDPSVTMESKRARVERQWREKYGDRRPYSLTSQYPPINY